VRPPRASAAAEQPAHVDRLFRSCTSSLGGALAGATFPPPPLATPCGTTSPCCYPDYNKVNGIGVPEHLRLPQRLVRRQALCQRRRNGNSGTLAVQNIFDFLNAWFAGGC